MIKFNKNFYYILIFNLLFSFFYFSFQPLLTGIALEYAKKKNYGIIRIFGTLGFGIMSIFFGIIGDNSKVFLIFGILSILIFFVIIKLPKIMFEKNIEAKFRIKDILPNKEIKLFIIYACFFNMTMGIYFNFYGIYYTTDLGGSIKMFGLLSSLATFSEIPFLVFSEKIIKKVGTYKILILSGILTAIRWFLTFAILSPFLQIFVQLLHGFGFIVLLTTMSIYINETVSENCKMTGQTLYAMVTLIFSKVIGSMIGGVLGDIIGEKNIFLVSGICTSLSVITLMFFYKKQEKFNIQN